MGYLKGLIVLCFSFFYFSVFSQPANDNCANASAITVDGGCVSGTTNGGGFETGEFTGCFTGGGGCNLDQSTWLSFNTGANTDLWLDFDVTNSPNCLGGYAVYGPFGSPTCLPGSGSQILCENVTPAIGGTMLNGLSANSTYMIQVLGRTGGGPGDRFIDYCVGLESPDNCGVCSSPCGAACGFNTAPTVAQVTSTCPIFNLSPHLSDGQTGSWCYTMTAVSSSVDFGMIINQIGCAGGNIVTMDWQVYNQGSCTGPVVTGSFPSLTATGLTVGNDYTFCYQLEVAASCTHTGHYPFWVGAVPLPMDLDVFDGTLVDDQVELFWITDIEDKVEFRIERSADGVNFEQIGLVLPEDGPGKNIESNPFGFITTGGTLKASGLKEFSFTDLQPLIGENFYRIVQLAETGELDASEMISFKWRPQDAVSTIFPVPAQSQASLEIISNTQEEARGRVLDIRGIELSQMTQQLDPGKNILEFNTENLSSGIYFVELIIGQEKYVRKLQIQ